IVDLLVLEHQAEMQNRTTMPNYQPRLAHRDADVINEMDNVPKGRLTESTSRRVDSAAEQLAKYLLFADETRLTDPVNGTSGFAEEFAQRGPFDRHGRSLRAFDLCRRLITP